MNSLRKPTVLLASLSLLVGCGDDGQQTTPTGSSGEDSEGGTENTPTGSSGGEGSEGSEGGTDSGSALQIERPDDPIEGQYIFVLDEAAVTPDMVSSLAQSLLAPHSGALLAVYDGALTGFSANGLDDARALAIAEDPRVVGIGQDGVIEVEAFQDGAPWNLDRIDTKPLALDDRYEYAATGEGVHAYIIDTGIRASHVDFGQRVAAGFTAINDGGGTNDCRGHGSHVAGTVGGAQYGVAKAVSLHPVRVLDCQGKGTISSLLAGIDWVTKNHQKPAVANMSLGGGAYSLLDDAVQKSIGAGVVYVLAAGNDDKDACEVSPARTAAALTVGATDKADKRASFSNWGTCVDLFAPGTEVLSAVHTADTGGKILQGTSMASPHVAGVVALHLQLNPTDDQATVNAALLAAATADAVTDAKGSPNKLLYSLFGDLTPPPLATSFKGFKNGNDQVSDAAGWNAADRRYGSIQYADVNGDKLDDICGYAPDGIRCAQSDGTAGFGGFDLWTAAISPATGWDPVENWSTLRFPDVDGDGKADVCGRSGMGIACAVSDGTAFVMDGFWTSEFGGWGNDPKYYSTIQFPDVDGDGKDDVCGRGSGGIVCALAVDGAFGPPSVWDAGFGDANGWGPEAYWSTVRFPDVNGDGKADVCGRGGAGIICATSSGTKFGGGNAWTNMFGDNGLWETDPKYYKTIQFADVDGDRTMDVCGRGANGLVCAVSKGTAFAAAENWTGDFSDFDSGTQPHYWSTIRLQDVDGDGKADACGRNADGIHCALSSGTAFVNNTVWDGGAYSDAAGWNVQASYWSTIRFPDLNGDGRADVCGRGAPGSRCALALP